MMTVHPWVSHPSVRAPPLVQSEWEQLPCGGAFDVLFVDAAHWPFEHVSVLAQARPHPPQLFGSLVVSTHCVPQTVPVHVLGGGLFVPASSLVLGGLCEPPSPLAMMPPSLCCARRSPGALPTAQATNEDRPMKTMRLRMTAGGVPRSRASFNALP